MTDLVVDPDIEDLLQRYLTTALASAGRPVLVQSRIPDDRPAAPRPAEWLCVRRTGGDRPTVVSGRPTVVVESYALLEGAAVSLGALAGAILRAMPSGDVRLDGLQVYGVTEVAGLASLPDPRVPDRVRYTQTLTVHIRGQVLTS